MEMVSITVEEYEEYKKLKELDFEFIQQVKENLEDAKKGNIVEW